MLSIYFESESLYVQELNNFAYVEIALFQKACDGVKVCMY